MVADRFSQFTCTFENISSQSHFPWLFTGEEVGFHLTMICSLGRKQVFRGFFQSSDVVNERIFFPYYFIVFL